LKQFVEEHNNWNKRS